MSHPPGTPDPPGEGDQPPFDPWAPGQWEPQYGQPPYGQPVYGEPGYGPPVYGAPRPTSGRAQAALWTGVGSLVLTFCCVVPGLAGAVAVVLGIRARHEIRQGGGREGGAGMALAGIITGAVAFVVALLLLALVVAVLAIGDESFQFDSTSV